MLPYWFLLRYYDTVNNPASTSPQNITLLEKLSMLDKSNKILIDKVNELDERVKKLESKNNG